MTSTMVSWIAFVIHLVHGYPLYSEVSPHAVCKVRWQLFGVTTPSYCFSTCSTLWLPALAHGVMQFHLWHGPVAVAVTCSGGVSAVSGGAAMTLTRTHVMCQCSIRSGKSLTARDLHVAFCHAHSSYKPERNFVWPSLVSINRSRRARKAIADALGLRL